LKSLSAWLLYGTACVVLKSLPVLSFAVDNIDFFLLNLSTPFLIDIFIVEKHSKLF